MMFQAKHKYLIELIKDVFEYSKRERIKTQSLELIEYPQMMFIFNY